MELSKEKIVVFSGLVTVAIVFVLHGLFYGPLIRLLQTQGLEYKNLAMTLSGEEGMINNFAGEIGERALISDSRISLAVDELTKAGKSRGVNIVSMKLDPIRESDDQQYRILPIRLEIESPYEVLGKFFGDIDSLKESLVTLESFSVTGQDKLKTTLIFNMSLVKE